MFTKERGERSTTLPTVANRAVATGRRPAGEKRTLRNPERSPGSSSWHPWEHAHRDGTTRSASPWGWGHHHISLIHSHLAPLLPAISCPSHATPDLSQASWSTQLLLVPKHHLTEHLGLASPAPNPPGARVCSLPPFPSQGPRDAVSGRVQIQSQRCQQNLWAVPLLGK